jgi:hypothetical protein
MARFKWLGEAEAVLTEIRTVTGSTLHALPEETHEVENVARAQLLDPLLEAVDKEAKALVSEAKKLLDGAVPGATDESDSTKEMNP